MSTTLEMLFLVDGSEDLNRRLLPPVQHYSCELYLVDKEDYLL